jgi:hypothetical protein
MSRQVCDSHFLPVYAVTPTVSNKSVKKQRTVLEEENGLDSWKIHEGREIKDNISSQTYTGSNTIFTNGKTVWSHCHQAPIPPGNGASRSTCSTFVRHSWLSRNKLAKYFLAPSLSCLTLLTSSLRLARSSIPWTRLVCKCDAGT